MLLTANFTLEEFQAVSSRKLTDDEVGKARYFAEHVLQPLRRAMGYPVRITSFLRQGDTGAHGEGEGIDISVDGNNPEKLEQMFQWIATYRAGYFGELIHERNHLHITRYGYRNEYGEVLREPKEGNYVLADIAIVVVPIAALLALGFLTGFIADGT